MQNLIRYFGVAGRWAGWLKNNIATSLFYLMGLTLGSIYPVFGQSMAGLAISDHSSLGASLMNPAAMVMSRKYFEVNLLNTHFFFQNNLGKLPKFSTSLPDEVFQNPNQGLKYLHQHLQVSSPSIMLSINRHAFSVRQSIRMASSAHRLPNDLSHILFHGHPPLANHTYQHNDRFDMATIGWLEWSASYAGLLGNLNGHLISGGIAAKTLKGLWGAFCNTDFITYEDRNNRSYDIHTIDAQMGLSVPLSYQSNDPFFDEIPLYGHGYAFDAGILITKPIMEHSQRNARIRDRMIRKNQGICGFEYIPYHYRLGVSLIDAGRIRYNSNLLYIDLHNASSVPGVDFIEQNVHSIDTFVQEVADYFHEQRDSISSERSFMIGLPTAVSAQLDYYAGQNIYLHALMVQDLPLFHIRAKSPSYLVFAPRYARHWFEASIPFTLYRYHQPRIGLAIRFWQLTLGTDRLGSFLGLNPYDGFDFYLSLNLGLYKGKCRDRRPACILY